MNKEEQKKFFRNNLRECFSGDNPEDMEIGTICPLKDERSEE